MPNPTSTSTSPTERPAEQDDADAGPSGAGLIDDPFAALPTETEIYIVPGGEVIIADLPVELAERLKDVRITDAPDDADFSLHPSSFIPNP
jgi:hypothetical protein